MTTTTNALDALLYIRNGIPSARWNFKDAVGSPSSNPGGIGNAVTLSYSFPQTQAPYASEKTFFAFNEVQQQAARQALNSIAEVCNVRFVEVSGVGQITFSNSVQPPSQGGYAYVPSFSSASRNGTIVSVNDSRTAGDIWMQSSMMTSNTWEVGRFGYMALLHELGHALGLRHPFEGGATRFQLDSSLNHVGNTVMSYAYPSNSLRMTPVGNASYASSLINPSTLMPMDIEALQYLYGVNTATRAGNDRYQWALNPEMRQTIWDGGGNDTVDCSNQTLTCIINLQDGSFSAISLRQTDAELRLGMDLPSRWPLPSGLYNGSNNLAIAKGAMIENAIGGSGADQLYGNALGNVLSGGAGADLLQGNGGDDRLDGGEGRDTLYGGEGNDTYTVDQRDDQAIELAGEGRDVVLSYASDYTLGLHIESGRIMLAGGAILRGNEQANVLYDGAGDDVLAGAAGNDSYLLRSGRDQVLEAEDGGRDTVLSYLADYTLAANVEDGRIVLASGGRLAGNALNNLLYASAGDDVLDGGDGSDSVSYRFALAGNSSGVRVSLQQSGGQATGAGRDTLTAIENLYGSEQADWLQGDAAANLLSGDDGDDTLEGGDGNDTLDGGRGADLLLGGLGNDSYYLREPGQQLQEAADGGRDFVYSYVASYTLGSNLENARIMLATGGSLLGNALDNVLYASAGDDVVDGGAGRDTLSYASLRQPAGSAGVNLSLASQAQQDNGVGSVQLSSIENLIGSQWADQLGGSDEANLLYGLAGDDSLSGGAGRDTLCGGLGADTLCGGEDRDVFDFNHLDEIGLLDTARDVILDFVSGVDRLDLSALDADVSTAANDAFSTLWLAATASFTQAGQLRFSEGVLYGNTDADSDAEFALTLLGVQSLVRADLVY